MAAATTPPVRFDVDEGKFFGALKADFEYKNWRDEKKNEILTAVEECLQNGKLTAHKHSPNKGPESPPPQSQVEVYSQPNKNEQSKYFGQTCLHIATDQTLLQTVEWLLDKGAITGARDHGGQTAWDLAISRVKTCAFERLTWAASVPFMEEIKVMDAYLTREVAINQLLGEHDGSTIVDEAKLRPFGWFLLKQQSLIPILYLTRLLEPMNHLRRSKIVGNVLRSFTEYRISKSSIFFRKSHFDGSRMSLDGIQGFLADNDYQVPHGKAQRDPEGDPEGEESLVSHDEVQREPDNDDRQVQPEANDRERSLRDILRDVQQKLENDSVWSLTIPYIVRCSRQTIMDHKSLVSGHAESMRYCCTADRAGSHLHLPLSLDEFSKPVLGVERLELRNKDQVISKYEEWRATGKMPIAASASKTDKADTSKSVIAVDQAWLWIFKAAAIAAVNHRGAKSPDLTIPYPQVWDTSGGRLRLMVGKFLSDLIRLQDDFRAHKSFDARSSEHTITNQTDRATELFDVYENFIHLLSDEALEYAKFKDRTATYFSVSDLDVTKEADLFHHIRDVREELSMIRAILRQQEEVWKKCIGTLFPDHWKENRFQNPAAVLWKIPMDAFNGQNIGDQRMASKYEPIWHEIARPQEQFANYKQRIVQLDEDAARVEASIETTLDLRAKHAGLQEAHSTALMSAAVFGFTLITIIFTPLSFMMALFALPIKRFQDHQVPSRWENTGAYHTHFIGRFTTAAELATIGVTALSMWAAVEFGLRGRMAKIKKASGYSEWRDKRKAEKAEAAKEKAKKEKAERDKAKREKAEKDEAEKGQTRTAQAQATQAPATQAQATQAQTRQVQTAQGETTQGATSAMPQYERAKVRAWQGPLAKLDTIWKRSRGLSAGQRPRSGKESGEGDRNTSSPRLLEEGSSS